MSINRPSSALLSGALIAALLAPATPAGAAPEVSCAACIVVDDTGRTLFARSANVMRANASTTKMTTALVTLRAVDPDDPVIVSAGAAATPGGGLALEAGEVLSVEALLHALLLTSSNDAAVALAEHVSGSEEAFVERMNAYARSIGAAATNYVTAHGLDMPGHGSSARDLATIAAALLEVPLLARIVARTEASIETPAGTALLENRNVLLEGYQGATGVKTGFTADAGHVLVASAERDGRRLIAVAMGSVDATADAAALLDHGWAQLERTMLLEPGIAVGALVFEHGSTEVRAARGVRGSDSPDEVAVQFVPDATIRIPVSPGEVVGQVTVSTAGGLLSTVDAVATSGIEPEATSWVSEAFAGLLRAAGSLVGEP